MFQAKLPAKCGRRGTPGSRTCEDLQPDLGQSRQRGLVEDTDVADLLYLRGVDPFTPDRLEDVPHGRRLLKCALQETWRGEKERVSSSAVAKSRPGSHPKSISIKFLIYSHDQTAWLLLDLSHLFGINQKRVNNRILGKTQRRLHNQNISQMPDNVSLAWDPFVYH